MDKVFSGWYILGDDWINLRLSQYVHMDRNPDTGYKIQDTCCGSSMVMLNLKLVKVNTADEASSTSNGTAPSGDVNHGTKVLK